MHFYPTHQCILVYRQCILVYHTSYQHLILIRSAGFTYCLLSKVQLNGEEGGLPSMPKVLMPTTFSIGAEYLACEGLRLSANLDGN